MVLLTVRMHGPFVLKIVVSAIVSPSRTDTSVRPGLTQILLSVRLLTLPLTLTLSLTEIVT